MADRVLERLRGLVEIPSVSADSNRAVAELVQADLVRLGFDSEMLSYADRNGVEKWSVVGTKQPQGGGSDSASPSGGFLYCAHSDVVPVTTWSFPESGPFELYQRDDRIYGRGSCDMKGSLACFLAAAEQLAEAHLSAPLSIICTADEEVGFLGAQDVVSNSRIYQQLVAQQPMTIVGEPTRLEIVHAHKGVYVFKATSHGVAGHSSTTHGENANLKMIPFLQEMLAIHNETLEDPAWRNSEFDPDIISWNIGINDFTPATNITPERSVCSVCFRPMPGQPVDQLMQRVESAASECGLTLELLQSASPFYANPNSDPIQALLTISGKSEAQRVCYGSDAAEFGALKNMVLCGPGNIEQAHTDDEWIEIEQLKMGAEFYARLIEHYCLS